MTRSGAAGVTRVTQRVPAALLRGGYCNACSACGSRDSCVRRHRPLRLRSGCASTGRAARCSSTATAMAASRRRGRSRCPSWRSGDSEWRRLEIELPLPDDVDEVAFGVSVRGQGTRLVRRARAHDRRDGFAAARRAGRVRYVDAALALMREHSLRRADGRLAERARAERWSTRAGRRRRPKRISPCGSPSASSATGTAICKAPAVTRALQTAAVSNARTGAARTAPHGRRLGGSRNLRCRGSRAARRSQQVEFAEELKRHRSSP